MDEYKKNVLRDRLHKLEDKKAIIRKRLGAIGNKPDQENILSTLIGKCYKGPNIEGQMIAFKVTDWIPDVSNFEIISEHITIFLLEEDPRTAAYYETECSSWIKGLTPEEAHKNFQEQYKEITEAEYNEYKKKAIEMISKNM